MLWGRTASMKCSFPMVTPQPVRSNIDVCRRSLSASAPRRAFALSLLYSSSYTISDLPWIRICRLGQVFIFGFCLRQEQEGSSSAGCCSAAAAAAPPSCPSDGVAAATPPPAPAIGRSGCGHDCLGNTSGARSGSSYS